MFQKEVAERIVAESNNSKYGRLSILTKIRKIKIVKKINRYKASKFFTTTKNR